MKIFYTRNEIRSGALEQWMEGRSALVELEIGSNYGELLCRAAAAHPERDFIGVEFVEKHARLAARRAIASDLRNVVVVNMEAQELFDFWSLESSVHAVHVYFPTPYPKALGLKHRLFTHRFVKSVYRLLVTYGAIRVVTDHTEYFNALVRDFEIADWWAVDWQVLDWGQDERFYVQSSCEVNYVDFYQRPIHAAQFLKRPNLF